MNNEWKTELAHKAIETLRNNGYTNVLVTDIRLRKSYLCICAIVNNRCFFSCGKNINDTANNLLRTVKSGLDVVCNEQMAVA